VVAVGRWLGVATLFGCAAAPRAPMAAVPYRGGTADRARADDAAMLAIPAGPFLAGSSLDEQARAYDDYRVTAGHDTARRRRWFARERAPRAVDLPAFLIDRTLVTNAAYAEFVADTGRPAPVIDEATWRAQGFAQDYATEVARFAWIGGAPPVGRDEHPVVLVTWAEAAAYCAWRGAVVGRPRRLPSADEHEKASRGTDGRAYPWGDDWDPSRLNSAVGGGRDTTPVGAYPTGASPYGLLDAAGNAFQWTATPWPHAAGKQTVKGSAWDDYGGLGRAAAAHGRAPSIRHAIVGFRCAGD
jgi:formylglycine-generating enzyme required for sulfatase activity